MMKSFFLLCLTTLLPLTALEYNAPVRGTTDNLSIWSESMGEWSEDKAIVLIAGCGGNARFWPDYFCEQLVDEGYFVIRFDFRDVGLSDPSPTPFHVSDLARDVVALLDAYQLEKAHIVGMSMGGMVAQFTAANYPHRIKTMTVLATAPIAATPRLDRPLSIKETLTLADTLYYLQTNPLSQHYEESLPTFVSRYARFNGNYPIDRQMVEEYAWSTYFRTIHPVSDTDNYHMNAVQMMMETMNQRREIFKRIVAPTLIIHGGVDTVILPGRGGEAIHEVIEGSRYKAYPNMGHAIYNRDLLDEIGKDILELISTSTL